MDKILYIDALTNLLNNNDSMRGIDAKNLAIRWCEWGLRLRHGIDMDIGELKYMFRKIK